MTLKSCFLVNHSKSLNHIFIISIYVPVFVSCKWLLIFPRLMWNVELLMVNGHTSSTMCFIHPPTNTHAEILIKYWTYMQHFICTIDEQTCGSVWIQSPRSRCSRPSTLGTTAHPKPICSGLMFRAVSAADGRAVDSLCFPGVLQWSSLILCWLYWNHLLIRIKNSLKTWLWVSNNS